MSGGFRNALRRPAVVHPLLFAAYPILFLYAHNIREMSAGQIAMPLAASILSTIALWGILSLILRSAVKAGLAATIFLSLFFSYGHFYDLLEKQGAFVPKHGHLLPTMLLAFGYCVYFIKIARRDFKVATKALNAMAIALIAINLFNIGAYHATAALSSPMHPSGPERLANASMDRGRLGAMPDIYLIILDEYAHPDTMREYYNYDNSPFLHSLERKGFFIAYNSKTRTGCTQWSIASLLNMEYVNDSEPIDVAVRRNANNEVVKFLRAKGYRYICFTSPVIFGNEHIDADLCYDFWGNEGGIAPRIEFHRLLLKMTMLKPFYNRIFGSQYEEYYRNIVINTLETLKKMPDIEGPKFVFAYFMCPHEPFVFGPGGESIGPMDFSNYRDKRFYLGQYIFISREIEKVVDEILRKSAAEPIIIIQSDHGLRPHHPGIEVGEDEWRKIFNAYYLPGDGKGLLYDSISPVNSFRLIFNHYFGADYILLEDEGRSL